MIEALQVRCATAQEGGFYTTNEIRSYLREIGTFDMALIEDGTYYVVELDGHVIGCGGWSARTTPRAVDDADIDVRSATPRIRAMFVDPRHARNGVGRAMMAHIEQAIRNAGYDTVVLTAMLSGVAFYHALRYRKIADNPVTLPSGVSLFSIDMLKQFDEPGRHIAAS
ncbi:MAG: GNAT family N-acetyltransferase [Pseudomonadota bacterium]